MGEHEHVLHGGVANAGAVVRIGDEVRRPSNPHTATIHALLRHVRARGVDVVPEPLGIDDRGRERLRFEPGDVAMPPFPAWSLTEQWLTSTAQLIRRLHDATVDFASPPDATWSDELADSSGVCEVICHADVCPENVVVRDGRAAVLLDFDFAAPGRRVHDLSAFATMCVPLDTETDAARLGRGGLDVPHRLRLVADAYGLDATGRVALLEDLDRRVRDGGQFVLRRVQAGEPAFIRMWQEMGGMARYDRRRAWFAEQLPVLAAALA
ncbi:MAG: phosphotransferase [Microthrixaceae bacterium]